MTTPWRHLNALLLSALLLSAAGGLACAPEPSKKFMKECVLPADQARTLSGQWRITPVPIAFHAGDFNDSEVSQILAAADTWNEFLGASKGIQLISRDANGQVRTSSAAAPQKGFLCSQGIVNGNQFVGNVVIYKKGTWANDADYPSDAIALTKFCTAKGTPYDSFYMATMEVNYQNFFVSGKKSPDLRTILLHEFGHLAGLNHSCGAATDEGFPNCSSSALPADYSAAIMFPIFRFDTRGVGEQKRSLGTNDQGRANCLYGATAGGS